MSRYYIYNNHLHRNGEPGPIAQFTCHDYLADELVQELNDTTTQEELEKLQQEYLSLAEYRDALWGERDELKDQLKTYEQLLDKLTF